MATPWDNIGIKKGQGGAGKVTEEQKNALIERAVTTWEEMGVKDPAQLAFGIAMMGLESGFNPHARGSSKTERGLGQFIDDTWGDAVKRYNKHHWPPVDPVKGRDDYDSQIRVIGAWIPYVWQKAGEIAADRNLKGYGPQQVAYSKWNKGQNADAEKVGAFLKENWKNPNIGGYFDTTYSRALQGLELRKSAGGTR